MKSLTIGARYDEMDPEDMKKMAALMPRGTNAYCPNGSHLCMWDDQEIYFHHLLKFLKSVWGVWRRLSSALHQRGDATNVLRKKVNASALICAWTSTRFTPGGSLQISGASLVSCGEHGARNT